MKNIFPARKIKVNKLLQKKVNDLEQENWQLRSRLSPKKNTRQKMPGNKAPVSAKRKRTKSAISPKPAAISTITP